MTHSPGVCFAAVLAVGAMSGCGGSSEAGPATTRQAAAVTQPSYAGARPLLPKAAKAAQPACRKYKRELSAAEVGLGTVDQFVESFGPTRTARGNLADRLARLGVAGSDGQLLRQFANQLRANNALLEDAERKSKGEDLDDVSKAVAPFNREAKRESRFARRLTLKDCA